MEVSLWNTNYIRDTTIDTAPVVAIRLSSTKDIKIICTTGTCTMSMVIMSMSIR